jgi:thiol-disulfide isomerase/thioredoxin
MRFLPIGVLGMALFAVRGAEVPRPSPPLTILRKGAPNIELKQYRGKVVALAFIHTTCPHCQALTRSFNALALEFAGKDAQFLECAFNDDAEATMPGFLALLQPPYPVGWSYRAPVLAYLKVSPLDALMVPHLVFLDRAGVIRREVGGQDAFFQDIDTNLRAELNRLLNQPK